MGTDDAPFPHGQVTALMIGGLQEAKGQQAAALGHCVLGSPATSSRVVRQQQQMLQHASQAWNSMLLSNRQAAMCCVCVLKCERGHALHPVELGMSAVASLRVASKAGLVLRCVSCMADMGA